MPKIAAPFLADKSSQELFAAFPDESLRYVGGCVRNALMGHAVDDLDLATTLVPQSVIDLLSAAKIKHIKTGFEHGTVTAVIDGKPFEITSLRKDVSTDGRRAAVAYTQDWAVDAARRDFTINALYASKDGEVFDPNGEGLSDLNARRLRFIGAPKDRIAEDYLRILRYFRFAAWYAPRASFDKDALEACREGRAGLKKLSAERVWSEIKKLLRAPAPARSVRVMLQNEILEAILPEASNAEGLELLQRLERREALAPDPYLRVMAMAAREPLPVALLCKRLKVSSAEAARLRGWADSAEPLDPHAPEREKLAAIYRAGKQVVLDRARIRAAGEADAIASSRWMSLADLAMGWTPPNFPVSGKDLREAGLEPGEAMGKALKALEALWVRSGFTADKARLMAALGLLR